MGKLLKDILFLACIVSHLKCAILSTPDRIYICIYHICTIFMTG